MLDHLDLIRDGTSSIHLFAEKYSSKDLKTSIKIIGNGTIQ